MTRGDSFMLSLACKTHETVVPWPSVLLMLASGGGRCGSRRVGKASIGIGKGNVSSGRSNRSDGKRQEPSPSSSSPSIQAAFTCTSPECHSGKRKSAIKASGKHHQSGGTLGWLIRLLGRGKALDQPKPMSSRQCE